MNKTNTPTSNQIRGCDVLEYEGEWKRGKYLVHWTVFCFLRQPFAENLSLVFAKWFVVFPPKLLASGIMPGNTTPLAGICTHPPTVCCGGTKIPACPWFMPSPSLLWPGRHVGSMPRPLFVYLPVFFFASNFHIVDNICCPVRHKKLLVLGLQSPLEESWCVEKICSKFIERQLGARFKDYSKVRLEDRQPLNGILVDVPLRSFSSEWGHDWKV